MANTGNVTTGLVTKTITIDTNLASKQYYLVNFDATDENVVNLAAAALLFPFVLLECSDGSTTAARGTIAVGGITKVKLGGTVAAGDPIVSDGNGKGVTSTTDGNRAGLIAMEGGVDGDIITALVAPHQIYVA